MKLAYGLSPQAADQALAPCKRRAVVEVQSSTHLMIWTRISSSPKISMLLQVLCSPHEQRIFFFYMQASTFEIRSEKVKIFPCSFCTKQPIAEFSTRHTHLTILPNCGNMLQTPSGPSQNCVCRAQLAMPLQEAPGMRRLHPQQQRASNPTQQMTLSVPFS